MCTGNICRSPMAEALLKYHLQKEGLGGVVISRGLAAPIGRVPHRYAQEVALAHGVPIESSKKSESVSSADMALASIILVMDKGHRREVERRFPTASGKTFLLGQWHDEEIPDPINAPLSAFEDVWLQCDRFSQEWVKRLVDARLLSSSPKQC